MNKIILSFDLDNTIFDITPLYEKAWYATHPFDEATLTQEKFKMPVNWDFTLDWDEKTSSILTDLFQSKDLTDIRLNDYRLQQAIRGLLYHPIFDVYFITDRYLSLYDNTVEQIRRNIYYDIPQEKIVNCYINKPRLLKTIIDINTTKQRSLIHFDDKPQTFIDCNKDNDYPVHCILISNKNTPYNHDLAKCLKNNDFEIFVYESLFDALLNIDNIISKIDFKSKQLAPRLKNTYIENIYNWK